MVMMKWQQTPQQCDDEGNMATVTMKLQRCDSKGTTTMRLRRRHHNNATTKATPQWR